MRSFQPSMFAIGLALFRTHCGEGFTTRATSAGTVAATSTGGANESGPTTGGAAATTTGGTGSGAGATTAAGTGTGTVTMAAKKFTLTVQGVNFTKDVGKEVHAVVLDANVKEGTGTATVVSGGTFSMTISDVLSSGVASELALYVDVIGDGVCEIPPDQAWLFPVPAANADATLEVNHQAPQQNVCGDF
jgi:hypothetical protein